MPANISRFGPQRSTSNPTIGEMSPNPIRYDQEQEIEADVLVIEGGNASCLFNCNSYTKCNSNFCNMLHFLYPFKILLCHPIFNNYLI